MSDPSFYTSFYSQDRNSSSTKIILFEPIISHGHPNSPFVRRLIKAIYDENNQLIPVMAYENHTLLDAELWEINYDTQTNFFSIRSKLSGVAKNSLSAVSANPNEGVKFKGFDENDALQQWIIQQ